MNLDVIYCIIDLFTIDISVIFLLTVFFVVFNLTLLTSGNQSLTFPDNVTQICAGNGNTSPQNGILYVSNIMTDNLGIPAFDNGAQNATCYTPPYTWVYSTDSQPGNDTFDLDVDFSSAGEQYVYYINVTGKFLVFTILILLPNIYILQKYKAYHFGNTYNII